VQPLRSAHLALTVLAVTLLVGSVAGCGDTEPERSSDEPAAVRIEGFAFEPGELTVRAGTSVTWTNHDDATHSVTQNAELLDSPDLADGDTYEVTFGDAGTYEYFCKFHPAMQATITVEG
jgi:plastocyanin